MNKISIVTPSFNSAKFIEDCIQSVLNQNYLNFEHIIIDGGSTDGTIEIKKYPHLKWISEPDEGIYDAMNKGIKLSSGEIIGILNSDDFYEPNIFMSIATIFRKDPKIALVHGDMKIIYNDNKVVYSRYKDYQKYYY